jgi:hypothetical protein
VGSLIGPHRRPARTFVLIVMLRLLFHATGGGRMILGPQVRPARIFVLTVMSDSSLIAIAQITIGVGGGSLGVPPQSRPARIFVLIFITCSSLRTELM